eukprot:jgi/Ulvmu1/2560/UM014_0011.1
MMSVSCSSRRQPDHARPAHTRAQASSSKDAATSVRQTPKTDDMVPLGASDVMVSAVGLGTIAWGDPTQGFGERFGEGNIRDICAEATNAGINFYDTAEVYGYQNNTKQASSEYIVGRCAATQKLDGRKIIVGSKYFTIPWTNMLLGGGFRFGTQAMADALDATLNRLGTDQVDLYQVHFPFPTYPQQVLMDGLREAIESGKAKAVGVCNYDAAQLEEACTLLGKHNIPIVSNQIEYSLVKRGPETTGLLAKCAELGVTPVAHSPLAQGLLTDFAQEREDDKAQEVKPVLQLLQFIGALSGGKSIEQVALNYLLCNGAVVIPGAKSTVQVQRNAGAMGWRLDENEVEIIRERLIALETGEK